MHPMDSFIVPAHKIVCAQNVFGVVVPDVQQAAIFPAFRFFGGDSLRDLDIELFILTGRHKVNFSVIGFPDVHGIPPAAKLQIHHVFQAGRHSIPVVAQSLCRNQVILRFQTAKLLDRVPFFGTSLPLPCRRRQPVPAAGLKSKRKNLAFIRCPFWLLALAVGRNPYFFWRGFCLFISLNLYTPII